MGGACGVVHRVPARLTAVEGRRFAFTVGGAFLLLASLAWWRTLPVGSAVFAALAVLLGVAGLLVPARLGPVQHAWMGVAAKLSKVTTPIVLGVVFFGVITPVALLLRLLGRTPLQEDAGAQTRWHERGPVAGGSDMTRQF